MSSPSVLDIEALLNPISEESPAGQDCREDSSPMSNYQQIKSARNAARSAERNNIFGGHNDEADENWRKVRQLAPTLLAEQSKDLEVASWFSEALIRSNGFSGLRDAFKLIDGLIERYWDNLYPMPDEDGLETKVAPLAGLNGEGAEGVIIAPIRNTYITEGSSVGPFSLWEYQQALEAHRINDESAREEKIGKLGYSMETVEKAVMESSNQFYIDLRDDVAECNEFFKSISTRLDELCGIHDAPPTSNIINILGEFHRSVCHLGQDKFPIEETLEEESPNPDQEGGAPMDQPTATSAVARGAINTREQAFKQLLEIAEYFRKNEPHSPVSYVLEKAVKWGKMPLDELMKELIPDDSSMKHYSMLTGIKSGDD